jgi:GT2 family glycosyltransferase
MNNKQTLTIIIISFNSYNEIINNLEYLESLHFHIPFKVLIIENGNFNKWEVCRNKNEFINVLDAKTNIGFAKANNLAVSHSSSDYLLFLNPDTLVTENFITPIISFIENSKVIGACAPMLNYEDGRYQSSTGFKMGFIFEFMEAFMCMNVYRMFKSFKFKNKAKNIEPVKVGWISGACMIIKKSVFESVDGFTEDYFLNYEDIDLCKKLEDRGYSNYYFPFLKCIHLDHKSFDNNYELLVYSRYQSRLIYAISHYGLLKKHTIKLIHILGLVLRLCLVNFFFAGIERKGRMNGYLKSLKLYIGFYS